MNGRGRLGAARDWLDESIALAHSCNYSRPFAFSRACLAALHAQCGEVEEAQRTFAAARTSSPDRQFAVTLTIDLAAAWIAVVTGEPATALDQILRAAQNARQAGVHSYEGWLLHDAARMGFAPDVADWLAKLAKSTDVALAYARSRGAIALASKQSADLLDAAAIAADTALDLFAAELAASASRIEQRTGEDRGRQPQQPSPRDISHTAATRALPACAAVCSAA